MEVLYEDNHLIIISKTCSEIVQADKTGDVTLSEMLQQYLKEKYNKPGNVFIGDPQTGPPHKRSRGVCEDIEKSVENERPVQDP